MQEAGDLVPRRGRKMKVHPAFLASAAAVQFTTLGMAANPHTRLLGFICGMVTGTILLLLALGFYPAPWDQSEGHPHS
jgi:hypothetical protein